MPDSPRSAGLWTPPQRGVLIGFVLVLSLVLAIRLLLNRSYVSDPPPARSARFDELADRIDPNVATWHDLAVLPQIGESRAKGIVAYREQFLARGGNRVAFRSPQDLLKVKGIGAATIQTLGPYLHFDEPGRAPPSQ